MTKLEIVDSGVAQLTKQKRSKMLGVDFLLGSSNNQDRYVYDSEHGIFAVADGVGGDDYGDKAATEACLAFHDELRTEDRAPITDEASLLIAQTSLLRIIHTAAQATGGYSTFTGFYRTKDNQVAYLHAGDSSLVRQRGNEIRHITSLHNLFGHSNQITNFVGGEHEVGPKRMAPQAGSQHMSLTEWGFIDVEDGDRLILVSDGVTSLMTGHELTDAEWLKRMYTKRSHRALGARAIAKRLVRASDRPDDATAVVVQFGIAQ